MHTETKDPSLYLCTALSRISDTVNASHHHLRHRHDNCINVSQHALLFLSRFVELKTVFTIALSGKKRNPVFPIFFCRSCPGAVHAIRLLLGLSVHAGVKFFQEGMIIPVRFVAGHRAIYVHACAGAIYTARHRSLAATKLPWDIISVTSSRRP